ncbi:MBL fold metallo-hydrolase [Vogesella sp. LIG4]|uniref:MBL fold metallo-hydrolase n=1 Tax=Vogesella sp. LIG4 TaxID=1192162 RepID=UPI0012FD34B0
MNWFCLLDFHALTGSGKQSGGSDHGFIQLRIKNGPWTGYVLMSEQKRPLFSGDSGYRPHFRDIGQRLGRLTRGPWTWGMYHTRWPLLHMTSEESALAATQLGARRLLPARGVSLQPSKTPLEHAIRAYRGSQPAPCLPAANTAHQ